MFQRYRWLCKITPHIWVTRYGFKEARLSAKIACVENGAFASFDEEPVQHQEIRIEYTSTKYQNTRMTAPGQWLASMRVIVTLSLSDKSITVGVSNGSALCSLQFREPRSKCWPNSRAGPSNQYNTCHHLAS